MKPFEFAGLDYFGPVAVLNSGKKFYVLLMTCLQIRAVHLELTQSLTVKDFCSAISRFFSRRGVPSTIRSDNAKTFKAAANKLVVSHGVKWIFNIQKAPWTGGVWERLVQSVKKCLRQSIKQVTIDVQEWETLLCFVESIINHRPLTYVTGNEESMIPLSPQNFLIPSQTSCKSQDEIRSQVALKKALSCNTALVKQFWKRWQTEYLVFLNKNSPVQSKHSIKVGDVLLLNEGTKRQYWPLVRVTEILQGRDGKTRSCKIQLRGKSITRPTKLLHQLELFG